MPEVSDARPGARSRSDATRHRSPPDRRVGPPSWERNGSVRELAACVRVRPSRTTRRAQAAAVIAPMLSLKVASSRSISRVTSPPTHRA
jgi:hypothetical protein